MARTELPNGVILPAEYSDDWYEDMTSNLTKLDDVIGSDSEKLNSNDVAFLRMSSAALTDGGTGNFSDLNSSNKLKTGDYVLDSGRKLYQVVSVDSTDETFTVGNSLFKITAESDLAPVAESGDYDDLDNKPDLNPYDQHIANTDIHVTTADKTKWNNGVSQAYVFRYSSTAITDNSTIAYSTIDNTDNIKSGDKILDVDGKLFEITAVDTTNQTVTVGSALIDLALDANVVHTSGNETISGFKDFENIRLTNSIRAITLDNQTADINDCYSSFSQPNSPKNGNVALYSCNTDVSTANITNLPEQKAFYLISITIRYLSNSPTVKQILFTRENIKYERLCNGGIWSNWVKDTDKFVTTDTAQTISGAKTFSEDIVINNSDTSQTTKRLVITSSKVNLGDNNSDLWGISFNAGSSYVATINSEKSINSVQGLNFTVRTKDGNNNLISTSYRLRVYTDGSAYLIPSTTDSISFGSSANRWKDVQTNLVNGLTPSSLGMPSDRSARVDISGYFTNTGTGNTNDYSVPANGFIFLNLLNAFTVICYSIDETNNVNYAQSYFRQVDGQIYILFPVRKNDTFRTLWTSNGGTITVTGAHFIPCLGNI